MSREMPLTVINSVRRVMGGNFSEEQTVAGTTVNSTTHSFPGADNATFTLHHSLNNSISTGALSSQSSSSSQNFPTVVQQVAPWSEDQYLFFGQESPSPLESDTNSDNATLDFAQFVHFNLCSDAPTTPPSLKTPEALPTRRRVPLTPTQPSESPQHRRETRREEPYCPSPGASILFTEPPQPMSPNVRSSQASPPSSAFTFSMARGGGPVTYSDPQPLPTFPPAPLEYHDLFPLPAALSTNEAEHYDFLPAPALFMPAHESFEEFLASFPESASTSTNEATRREVEVDSLRAPQPVPSSSVWDVHATPPSSAFSFRMAPDGSFVTPNPDSGPLPRLAGSRETRDDIEQHNMAVYGQMWSPSIYCRWGGNCFDMIKHSEEAIQEHIRIKHNVNLKGKHRLLCLWDGTCDARVNGVSAGEMARHINTTDGHPMSLVASDVTGWAKRANACTLCTAVFARSDSRIRHLRIKHGVVMAKRAKN